MTLSKKERWIKYLNDKKKPVKKVSNPKRKKKVKKKVNKQFTPLQIQRAATKLKHEQIKYNSALERRFRKLLDENEILHVWQKPLYTDYRYVCVDFYIPEKKIIVELDGSHHDVKGQAKKDQERTDWIIKNFDIKEVIRIHYMDFKDNQVEDFVLDRLE